MGLFDPGRGGLFGTTDPNRGLQKRLDRLENVASENGVLEKGLIPDGLKTAFARVVDVLMRPNYAVAGAVDTLAGNGRANENFGGRIFRELFGEGDKETFGTVLEQAGFGEGGRLSDLVGANWVTKRWDPTMRGTVGLALDVFLDPLTYTGFKGGRFFVHGKAGSFRLNKAGQVLLEQRAKKNILQFGVKEGLLTADDIVPVMRGGKTAAGKALDDIIPEAIKIRQSTNQWKNLGKLGEVWTKREFYREAEETIARRMRMGGLKGAQDPLALKFGTIPIVNADKLTAPVKDLFGKLGAAIEKVPSGEAFTDLVRASRDNMDKIFNMVPWGARAKPAYMAFESLNFATKNQAEAIALQIVKDQVFGDEVFKKVVKSEDAMWALMRALDDPKYADDWVKAAEKAGIVPEQAAKVMDDWAGLMDGVYAVERDRGLQTGGRVENYIAHMMSDSLNNQKVKAIQGDEVLSAALLSSSKMKGETVGRFAKRRQFQTFDQLFEAARKKGFENPEELVNRNVVDVMVRRVQAHYEALADRQFLDDVLGTYAAGKVMDQGKRIQKMLPETGEGLAEDIIAKRITVEEAQAIRYEIQEAMSEMGFTLTDQPSKAALKGQKKYLKDLPKLHQAIFFQEMIPQITNLSDLNQFVKSYGKALNKIPRKYLNKVRAAGRSTNRVPLETLPKGYVRYSLGEGTYKGTWALPEGVAHGLENWKGVWAENEEVRGFVKAVDWMTNWFKLAVTAPFPAFHVRNAYSNIFASAVDIRFAAFNPNMHRKIVQLLATDAEWTIVSKTGEHITSAEMKSELKGLGITVDDFLLAERTGAKNALTKNQSANLIQKVAKSGARTGRAIENEARALHYMTLRERGLSPGDALVKVNEFLFDYNRLSPTEKNVFRRLIPFYTWNSKNIRRQAKNLLERPGELMAPVKAFNQGPDSDALPEYLHGKLGIKLMHKPGSAWASITGLDLPVSNIDILWKGGLGKTIRSNIAMMNPLLKAPLEYALNMDSFTGRGIRGRQWLGQMGPAMDRNLPQWMKDYFQLQKHENGSYTANGTRVYLLVKSAIWSRFASTSVKVDEIIADPRTAAGWWRLMSGLNFQEFDMNEAEANEIRNKVDRLEQYLLDHGFAQEFRVVSPQKERQEKVTFGGNLFGTKNDN